jgi:hypothetical protein
MHCWLACSRLNTTKNKKKIVAIQLRPT